MPLRVASVSAKGAQQGWRPRLEDPASRALAASLMAPQIAAWLEKKDEFSPTPDVSEEGLELAARMLLETASEDEDGYRLARKLETAFGIKPDAELVDILSKWNETLDRATSDLEKRKVAELKIEPPFGFAAKAIYTDQDGHRVDGIAFRVANDTDARVAFVSDENPMDEGPDLSVIAVELENIEVTGPAPERAFSLHPFVMSAVSSYENAVLMESMEKYAETDMAVFDVELEQLAAEQVEAGGEAFAIHVEMSERLCRAFEDAVDTGRFDEAWVAGMMAAASMRRTTMMVGVPPEDAERLRELMIKICEYLEGPGRPEARPIASAPKLLH